LQKALFIRQNASNTYFSNSLVDFANNIELQKFQPRIKYEVEHARSQTPGFQATYYNLLGGFGACG
jgi:hypothetical protein